MRRSYDSHRPLPPRRHARIPSPRLSRSAARRGPRRDRAASRPGSESQLGDSDRRGSPDRPRAAGPAPPARVGARLKRPRRLNDPENPGAHPPESSARLLRRGCGPTSGGSELEGPTSPSGLKKLPARAGSDTRAGVGGQGRSLRARRARRASGTTPFSLEECRALPRSTGAGKHDQQRAAALARHRRPQRHRRPPRGEQGSGLRRPRRVTPWPGDSVASRPMLAAVPPADASQRRRGIGQPPRGGWRARSTGARRQDQQRAATLLLVSISFHCPAPQGRAASIRRKHSL